MTRVDLRLECSTQEEFWRLAQSLVTLKNGNVCWTPWAHQVRDCPGYRKPGYGYELRYGSGDEVFYSREGTYFGKNRDFDIIAIERGVSADEALRRGIPCLDWPGIDVAN